MIGDAGKALCMGFPAGIWHPANAQVQNEGFSASFRHETRFLLPRACTGCDDGPSGAGSRLVLDPESKARSQTQSLLLPLLSPLYITPSKITAAHSHWGLPPPSPLLGRCLKGLIHFVQNQMGKMWAAK